MTFTDLDLVFFEMDPKPTLENRPSVSGYSSEYQTDVRGVETFQSKFASYKDAFILFTF